MCWQFQYLKRATRMFTDMNFRYSILKMVQRHARVSKNSKAYLYRFNYRGVLSMTCRDLDNNQNVGVSEGDILIYLFPIPGEYFRQCGMIRSEEDLKYVDIAVDYFTSFVIDGYACMQLRKNVYMFCEYVNAMFSYIFAENPVIDMILLICGNHFRMNRLS